MVAYHFGVVGVVGSNPAAPIPKKPSQRGGFVIFIAKISLLSTFGQ
ncbi:hypothetical protein H1P_1970012 [Hyella patelloides LEGE 07179]|uniref:Uncharacterized protein n=1 Tax=Hyella patelloides LEGE 07179 TaxID=945734 RepID=A0A563VPR4_9CYAN|nr:hypothetical protein H1P_1970012 [Hyella patelloides LEGE 07179]